MSPDATVNPLPPGVLPPGVERKDASVNIQGLNPVLMQFLARLGLVHLHLFNTPLMLTSAVDAKHAVGSKHYKGDAVDLRIVDIGRPGSTTQLLVVRELCQEFKCCVFDESNLTVGPHYHVEIAG